MFLLPRIRKESSIERTTSSLTLLDLDLENSLKSVLSTRKISSFSDAGKPEGKEVKVRKPRCMGLSALSSPQKRISAFLHRGP